MLERGFLKHLESKEDFLATRRRRILFAVGVFFILFALIYMMFHIQIRAGFIVGVSMLIIGFCMISVSMWMNFFAQKDQRKKSE